MAKLTLVEKIKDLVYALDTEHWYGLLQVLVGSSSLLRFVL